MPVTDFPLPVGIPSAVKRSLLKTTLSIAVI
jgi:hypothetical protein